MLRLGNETVALLQSHPNEALALLQCHPNQKGPLTAPILMALLQRQYSWHSYSTKTDGTQCQFSPASLALLQCQPSLLALLQCQGFPRLLQLLQGKSCLTGTCKIRRDMWLVNETADIWVLTGISKNITKLPNNSYFQVNTKSYLAIIFFALCCSGCVSSKWTLFWFSCSDFFK